MAQLQQLQPYMPYIVMAVTGLIAGWLAGLLLGGGGLFRNLVVGIIGAFVGGLLVKYGIIGMPDPVMNPAALLKIPYNFNSLIPVYGNQIAISTIGALIVVILARIFGR
jgi:uncharacterized membrane protein YeaQ/YmgE (transglycosylase-associated protein family)